MAEQKQRAFQRGRLRATLWSEARTPSGSRPTENRAVDQYYPMSHLLLAAPNKSSGKTTLTLGLCAALARRSLAVQAFKKGPDYIDPMWLGKASGRPCYNLDFNTMSEAEISKEFACRSAASDISLIEGNMGLFDSLDKEGRHSNAALAKLLGAPVVLVVDVRGATRSIVPLLLGFQRFDPSINIAGVILNKVAGTRHESRLREVIAHYTDLPVIGAVHRDNRLAIDERHLGLVPSNEAGQADEHLEYIATVVSEQVDLDRLCGIARNASPRPLCPVSMVPAPAKPDVRIAIAKDSAFGFYYPGDIESLRAAGAELVEFSTLQDRRLPEADGLFIGGGFPETHMDALQANTELRRSIKSAIEEGMPAYAECGGLMYLSRSLVWNGKQREMVGVIPGDAAMHRKPVGRGYVRLRPVAHPWRYSPEHALNAHEFHYSSLTNLDTANLKFAYEVERGVGIDGRHDGIVYKNLLASYVHMRDVENNHWTRHFVDFVRRVRNENPTARGQGNAS